MKSRSCLLCLFILAVAPAIHGQTTINLGSPPPGTESGNAAPNLPLRNLQIEVRQIQDEDASRERVEATAAVRLQPGQSSAAVGINAQSNERRRSGSSQQLVLVLNGRHAAIILGNSVPLRVFQSRLRNGVLRAVPGIVWLEAGTGFDAVARWEGGGMVDLELTAMQSRAGPPSQSSATSTSLTLPLDEWFTIAESDQDLSNGQSGTGGYSRASGQSQLKVQVRVSVR
jgi:hypothetical protein